MIAALIVLGRAALPLLNPTPITLTDTVGDSQLTFTASRPVAFWQRSACVDLSWDVNNIREIFFMGKGTIGSHTETRCIIENGSTSAWLRVHYGRNVWEHYHLHYVTFTPLTLIYIVSLIAASGISVLVPLPRPVPLADARTIRDYLPYTLPLFFPLGYLLITNALTLNFGWHWDEMTLINQVRRSIDQGTLIPDFYNYPSLNFTLVLVALLRNPAMLFSGDPVIIDQITRENEYLFFARGLFLFVSATAIIWTYLLVLTWRKSWVAALFAAAVFSLSWEVAYHLRWIAPDGLLMTFGALTILLAVSAYRQPTKAWLLWGAVIAAGFAVGSKYPGGLIVIPVGFVGLLRWWGQPIPVLIRRAVIAAFVFIAAYLVTTPGTVLAFDDFRYDILHEIAHYGDMGQGYYTVEEGFSHLGQLLAYLSLVLFSHYPLIAGALFALVPIGAFALIREDWRLALIFLSFPVIYVLYFSTQSLMYVRNMLVTVPFWAFLATNGAWVITNMLRRRSLRWGFAALLAGLLTVNAIWIATAAHSISVRGMTRDVAPFLLLTESNPDTIYWAAEGLYEQMLERYGDDLPPNIQPTSRDADMLAIYMSDNLLEFDTNYGRYLGRRFEQPWRGAITSFGPFDVNLNYYPGWNGDDRIVVFPIRYVTDWLLESSTAQPQLLSAGDEP